jgi:hypothetical protein
LEDVPSFAPIRAYWRFKAAIASPVFGVVAAKFFNSSYGVDADLFGVSAIRRVVEQRGRIRPGFVTRRAEHRAARWSQPITMTMISLT